jgi:hypothetical protein
MAIVEDQAYRIVPNRLDGGDLNILLTGLQGPLAGPMAYDLRRWRVDAQVFEWQFKSIAIVDTILFLIILLMALEYVPAQIFVFRQLGQMVVNIAGIDLQA